MNSASFRLFEWAGLSRYDDVDVDEVDFRDPYPNPEELILAMESVVGRGFWSFGVPREEEPTLKADRDARRKYRRKPPAPVSEPSPTEGVTVDMMTRLCCPKCDSTYLHQIAVFAGFRRVEDEPESITVAVDKTGVRTQLARLEGRRDEAVLYFACEQCTPENKWTVPDPELALRIYQHKGETLLEWLLMAGKPVELDPA